VFEVHLGAVQVWGFNFFSASLLTRSVSLDALVRFVFVASAVSAWVSASFSGGSLGGNAHGRSASRLCFWSPRKTAPLSISSSMGFGPDTLLPSLLYSMRNFLCFLILLSIDLGLLLRISICCSLTGLRFSARHFRCFDLCLAAVRAAVSFASVCGPVRLRSFSLILIFSPRSLIPAISHSSGSGLGCSRQQARQECLFHRSFCCLCSFIGCQPGVAATSSILSFFIAVLS
jgi:hypothetical protein